MPFNLVDGLYIYQTKQTNYYRYLDVALFLFLPS